MQKKIADFAIKAGLPTSEITKNSPQSRFELVWYIYSDPYSECSCPDGSEYVWQRGVGSKAELRPPEVDPYFERKKKTKKGVAIADTTTIFKNQPSP